ncbi:iron complex transport system ATP-binding protein [Desulfacinum hydrothermale DSM 13146]|uniref:Iron complex transport system ATP-binding protein n=1 Tax=Desulfacinum hydrothermale DSM 13146 TaxID=1121390 RepID=A0A1W1WXT3_9BACT|nr:ABC transporter ATP-binding protein [Desulfacinum hydrothermale]SMC16417.1 iron complex transport system ATP-binding protein [Desulfacinum hydrothermale DSM 13146]
MIRVSHLHCGYPGRPVLRDVNLHVERGEFVGILGPNGSGKTTLLLALTGYLRPDSGTITIDGRPLEELSSRQRAQKTAVVLQDSQVRFPYSCAEVVAMGRYPHQDRWRGPTPRDAEVVQWAMECTHTLELADRPISATSGGERQRVMMAKALAQETPILLLDEATSAMDVHWRLKAFELFQQLQRHQRKTILAILHDVNLAAVFCPRLVFLKDGIVAADGPTRDVLTPATLERVYHSPALVYDVPENGTRQVFFVPEEQGTPS